MDPSAAVHPHVERRVLGVGEAALADVELHGGDAEVEEHRVDRVEAEIVEHVGDLVVDRVHAGEAGAVRREPLPRQRERLGVAVDADHPGELAALQHGLGVAAQAEGRVDEHGAVMVERRRQEGDDPVEEDRDVGGALIVPAQRPQWASRTRAPARADGGRRREDHQRAASRAWWRTRRTGAPSARDRRDAHESRPSCWCCGGAMWCGWCGCASGPRIVRPGPRPLVATGKSPSGTGEGAPEVGASGLRPRRTIAVELGRAGWTVVRPATGRGRPLR